MESSFQLALGKTKEQATVIKNEPFLSHSSHGVLQPFEFTFQIEILDLMPVQVRIEEFYRIDFRAASVTHGCLIDNIVHMDIRIPRAF